MNERKERVEDAILATRSAITSGIVPGGEITFLRVKDKLVAETPEEEYAFRILSSAIQKPFDKLLKNAGFDPGYFLAKIEGMERNFGVDVTNGEIKDMVKAGIIDPTSVLTGALRLATSVAISLLTSDGATAVHEDKEDK
jgi:chaperonin GroEL